MARKKRALTPALIDTLSIGCIPDLLMPGLSIAVLGSGKEVWKYYRRLAGGARFLKQALGQFPAFSIADVRANRLCRRA